MIEFVWVVNIKLDVLMIVCNNAKYAINCSFELSERFVAYMKLY